MAEKSRDLIIHGEQRLSIASNEIEDETHFLDKCIIINRYDHTKSEV